MIGAPRWSPWILAVPVLFVVAPYAVSAPMRLLLPAEAFSELGSVRVPTVGQEATFGGGLDTDQPLWRGLLSLVGLAGMSRDAFVIVALALQGALLAGTVMVLYRACARVTRPVSAAGLVTAAMWLGNFYVSRTLVNGLESAILVAALVALAARASVVFESDYRLPPESGFALGLLSSLVLLCRIDTLSLVASVPIVWGIARRRFLRREWPAIAIFLLVSLTTGVVYAAAGSLPFGPSTSVLHWFGRLLGSPRPSAVGALSYVALCGGVVAAYVWVAKGSPLSRSRKSVAYSILTVGVLTFHAQASLVRGVTVPRPRDLAPLALWGLATIWCLLERLPERTPLIRAGSVALLAAALASWALGFNRGAYDLHLQQREMGEWINANLPADAVVAGWDTAVTGYYSDRPVIELGGRSGDPALAQAIANGSAIDYLDRAGVTHLLRSSAIDFDQFEPIGYDLQELRSRARRSLVAKIAVARPSLGGLLLRARTTTALRVEVRDYERPPVSAAP